MKHQDILARHRRAVAAARADQQPTDIPDTPGATQPEHADRPEHTEPSAAATRKTTLLGGLLGAGIALLGG